MTDDDWHRVIADAAAIGVGRIELIGGEPTTYPNWPSLVDCALDRGLRVTIYSNLLNIRPSWWPILSRAGVSLATSWYSDLPEEHDQITGRQGSHARTRANIAEAVRSHIPIRVGMTAVLGEQRIEQGRVDLISLGVPAAEIRLDRTRRIGRAAGLDRTELDVSELCGNCGHGSAAIMPDGAVAPCIMSGELVAGNVLHNNSLERIFNSSEWTRQVALIPRSNRVVLQMIHVRQYAIQL